MASYAAGTEVSADRSRGEIEKIVSRFGADSFAYGWEGQNAVIGFRLGSRQYRFDLPLPSPDAEEFQLTPTYRQRSASAARAEYEQAVRQRWRALALIVKAKFAAVDAGISTIEREFLAQVVLPDGRTVGEYAAPAIAEAYDTGRVPRMLAIEGGH